MVSALNARVRVWPSGCPNQLREGRNWWKHVQEKPSEVELNWASWEGSTSPHARVLPLPGFTQRATKILSAWDHTTSWTSCPPGKANQEVLSHHPWRKREGKRGKEKEKAGKENKEIHLFGPPSSIWLLFQFLKNVSQTRAVVSMNSW